MWRIERAEYAQFGPFAETSVEFPNRGLVIVEGRITYGYVERSNGAGKSAIFDGVAWALYGRCIRAAYKGDDVIRNGQRWCSVTVVLNEDTAGQVVVTRYRRHPTYANTVRVTVGGQDSTRGTDADTTQFIVDAMGMDYLTFANSVAFGARDDVCGFLTATDAERKRTLETLLGMGEYTAGEAAARSRIAESEGRLAEVSNLCASESGEIAAYSNSLALMRQRQTEDRESAIAAAKAELVKAEAARAVATSAKKNCDAALRAAEREHQPVQRDYEDALAAFERDRQCHIDSMTTATRDLGVVEGSLSSAMRDVDSIKAVTDAGVCPTCSRRVKQSDFKKRLAELNADCRRLGSQADALRMQVDLEQRTLRSLVPPDEPDTSALDSARDNAERATTRLADADTCVARAARDLAEAQSVQVSSDIQETEKALVRLRKELESHEAERESLELWVKALAFWVEGFGNRGIKSYRIEEQLPIISAKATTYANRLLAAGTTLTLSATTRLKTRDAEQERLSVSASIPGCAQSYAGASRGQKATLDLALLLAFHDIVADRSGKAFGQLFVDELVDGLDDVGKSRAVMLLREMAEKRAVVLVTHDSRLKQSADAVWTVVHDGECATIMSDSRGKVAQKVIRGERAKQR